MTRECAGRATEQNKIELEIASHFEGVLEWVEEGEAVLDNCLGRL
jgi:hypothetical protein